MLERAPGLDLERVRGATAAAARRRFLLREFHVLARGGEGRVRGRHGDIAVAVARRAAVRGGRIPRLLRRPRGFSLTLLRRLDLARLLLLHRALLHATRAAIAVAASARATEQTPACGP